MSDGKKYWGKYRGTVINNIDPEQRGRLMVMVPDVLGEIPCTWAEACPPLAGPTGPPMGVYLVPKVRAGVWVEFEHGNPNHPIWVGCRWGGPSDIPVLAKAGNPVDPNIIIQSSLQHTIMISDLPGPTGGILLKTSTGAMISISDTGITISNGQGAMINLQGNSVDINGGALTII